MFVNERVNKEEYDNLNNFLNNAKKKIILKENEVISRMSNGVISLGPTSEISEG